jgi:hypothetical protein
VSPSPGSSGRASGGNAADKVPAKRAATKKPASARAAKKRAASRTPVDGPPQAEPEASSDARSDAGPPAYDQAAVGRVVGRIEIRDVELVHAHFDRDDDGPLAVRAPSELEPDILIDVEWRQDGPSFGCLIRFGAECDDGHPLPFRLFAFFRVTYTISGDEPVSSGDLDQFAHWNAVFNAWPYWREYLSSTINRSGLPRVVLPVMRVPRQGDG